MPHHTVTRPLRKNPNEQLMLSYFNRTLLKKGIISQSDYRRMARKISTRSATKEKCER